MSVPGYGIASLGIYLHGEVRSGRPRTVLRNRLVPCVTVWADDRHDRLKAIGEDDAGTCSGRSPRVAWNRPPTAAASTMSVACLPSATPTAAPTNSRATAPTAATSDEPDDEKQNDGAYCGVDDRTDDSHTKMQTEPRHQPITDEGTDNADDHVTDEAEAGPLDDLTGQPAGYQTDQ